ncbi:hypothetical protein D3C85_1045170 [compost metagenome]
MPTPSAITGRVATFTPIPSTAINASQRIEVMTSGITATTTARQLRKVMKHSTMTAAYTYSSINRLAFSTTMLVTASMPAGPAASRNFRSSPSCSAANRSTAATTPFRVSAL